MDNPGGTKPSGNVPVYRLAKVLGVLALTSAAIANEYGATVNYASTNSLAVYPGAQDLVPLAMLLAGIVLLPKVVLYMRFSTVMPRAGSFYVWIGRTLNLPIGFVASFLNWVALAAGMGVVAFAFATFLSQGLVGAGITQGAALITKPGHLILGLAAIWIVYLVHMLGVKVYGGIVTVLFALIALSALVIIGYGFLTSPEHFTQLADSASGLTLRAPTNPPPADFASVLSVTALLVAAYGGLNSATALGGEARDASRTTPRGLLFGWLIALVLYSAVMFAIFHAAPWWAIVALVHSNHAAAATAPGLIGLVAPRAISVTLNLVVAVVVGKTLFPQMLVCSRSVFAWAEDHLVPEVFLQTTERKVPHAGLLLTALLGSGFLIESTLIGWQIGFIIRSIAILLVLALVAAGTLHVRLNRRFHDVEWARAVSRGPWVMIAAVVAIIVAVVLVGGVLNVPKTPLVFQPWLQTLAAIALGSIVYVIGAARAKRTGHDMAQVAAALPLE
jgi:amino acid transporter